MDFGLWALRQKDRLEQIVWGHGFQAIDDLERWWESLIDLSIGAFQLRRCVGRGEAATDVVISI